MKFSKSTGCFYPGNIKYSSLPADLADVPDSDYALAAQRAAGETLDLVNGRIVIVPAPPMTDEQIEAELSKAVQRVLDTEARTHLYDGILSLCSYAESTNANFKAEALAGVAWRDAVWAHCYQVLSDIKAGNRAVPTAAELLAELPAMAWPT